MVKNISEFIEKKDYVLDKVLFNGNDYFRFVGNAKLAIKILLFLLEEQFHRRKRIFLI